MGMTTRLHRLLLGMATIALAAGCADRVTSVRVHPFPAKLREIEIRYRTWDAASPCADPRTATAMPGAAYIYTGEDNGEIDASRMTFTFVRGRTVPPGIIEKLKGTIHLEDTSIRIQLEFPYFDQDNRVDHYVPCPFNGTYPITQPRP
jgi:hypothetical protein